MDPTMVILAAFYILLTHICSDLCLMPQGQIRGSNAFSLDRELQFRGRHEIDISLSECWHTTHTITITISAASSQNRPRKHVRYKSISHSEINMPTTCTIPILSTFATSSNVPEETNSTFSSNGEKEPIVHAPPHFPPTRTGKMPPTKMQLAAECKANKELKIKAAKEKAEGKKIAAEDRKKAAMIKKQDKLISSAESKALKAASKAKELRKLADGIKSTGGTGGGTSPPGSNHSNKRSKGDSGHLAGTSSSVPTINLSPQCKEDSTKRVSRQSPENSPHREAGGHFLHDGSSEFSQGSGSSYEMDTLDEDRRVLPISRRKIAQVTLPAQGRGGHRAAAPYAWGQGS